MSFTLLINMMGYENVSLEEVVKTYPLLINAMIVILEDFDEAVEDFKSTYSTVFNLEDFNNYGANIEPIQKCFLEEVANQVWKNNNYLNKMEQEIEQLKEIENYLLGLVSKSEQQLSIINSKISSIQRKKENLQGTCNEIQLCKLVTNTSFVYKTVKISGYVIGPVSKTINCFELDPTELSESEITNSLYDLIKKNSEIETTNKLMEK